MKITNREIASQLLKYLGEIQPFVRKLPPERPLAHSQITSNVSDEQVYEGVEKALRKYFGKRGERVVQDNLLAVERGYREVIEVPREVMSATAKVDKASAGLRIV